MTPNDKMAFYQELYGMFTPAMLKDEHRHVLESIDELDDLEAGAFRIVGMGDGLGNPQIDATWLEAARKHRQTADEFVMRASILTNMLTDGTTYRLG